MAEIPPPQAEAPVAPPPPAPEAPVTAAPETVALTPNPVEQQAGNNELQNLADNIRNANVDPSAALEQLATDPSAFGEAPKEDGQQSITPQVDQAEARHNELMNMNTDQLKDLAAKGDKDAESVLKNMKNSIQPAVPEAPAKPDDTAESEARMLPPTQPETVQPASGEQVAPQIPTAEGTQTIEDTDNSTEAENTPDKKTIAEREKAIDMGQELSALGITKENPQYEVFRKALAENPNAMEEIKRTIDAQKAVAEAVGVEVTATSAQATAEALQREVDQEEQDGKGSSAVTKRKKLIIGILLALLAIPAVAIAGAAVAGGVVAFGLAGAAAKGGKG